MSLADLFFGTSPYMRFGMDGKSNDLDWGFGSNNKKPQTPEFPGFTNRNYKDFFNAFKQPQSPEFAGLGNRDYRDFMSGLKKHQKPKSKESKLNKKKYEINQTHDKDDSKDDSKSNGNKTVKDDVIKSVIPEKFKSIDFQDIGADMARRYQGFVVAHKTGVNLMLQWEPLIDYFNMDHHKYVITPKTFTALSTTNEITVWNLSDNQKKLLLKMLNTKFPGIEIERRT